eukprot:TRINITY_DN36182_c0_g1_i1.p1 TRINITY_DN36182_c0_g1~~TRINITY_DN36182_c0_g1_i1.p1  ORF type:complete len:326 (-),score=30.11 TRINITY_DN36182_c0_g1_i1:110-1087(-)
MGLDSTEAAMDIFKKHSFYRVDPDPTDHQNSQEYHLHVGLRASKHHTTDIAEADAIFVASYDTLGCESALVDGDGFEAGCAQSASDLHNIMESKLWKASGGNKLVFTAGHPWAWNHAPLEGKGIRLQVDDDLTLPGHSAVNIPYVLKRNARAPTTRHRKLFFSAGHCGGNVRKHVLQRFAAQPKRPDVELVCNNCPGVESVPPSYYEPGQYEEQLSVSQFCLVMPGDTVSSRRDLEVALFGCLPIYVGRALDSLPFKDIVPYQEFALFFPANTDPIKIMQEIDSMSSEEQDKRRTRMKQVIPKTNLRVQEGIASTAQEICRAARQ